MSWERNATYLLWVGIAVVLLALIKPEYLSDQNSFLKEFVDHDLMSFLGIILTISLGFLTQLHILVGKLSENLDEDAIADLRAELKSTAKVLIGLFFCSVLLAIAKPLFVGTPIVEAILNSVAIFLMTFFFLILADIVLAILDFDIK